MTYRRSLLFCRDPGNELQRMMDPVCLADVEDFAKKHLPKHAFDYFAGGANEESTLEENVKAFKRLKIRTRVLCGISQVDLSTTILGRKISMPICIAPTATQKLAHPDGETATAKAAAKADTCMILSMMGTTRLEDVAMAVPDSLKWIQLYFLRSPAIMKDLVHLAEKTGYKAIVLTADAIVRGIRLRDIRNRSLLLPFVMDFPNIKSVYIADVKKSSNYEQLSQESGFAFDTFVKSFLEKSISYKTIDWLKTITNLPIIVKGILTADDARKAVEHGADGIIVSNHGGRQLDCVPATIEVLPEIVDAVKGRAEVYLDGGIRLGTDVLKALALGARAVFIGRPAVWGLAYKGEEGVSKVLELLKEEFEVAMLLSGCPTVAEINSSLVTKNPARL